MKLIHLSDLHIGKRVNDYSMLEDQEYILKEILEIIDEEKPDAVLIAGDVYDKSVPAAEAVRLFDDFLARLAKRTVHIFIISGNHDSPERVAFGGRLMQKSHVYLSPVYNGDAEAITLEDDFGKVNFYLLPFLKPANVRTVFPNADIMSYTDALQTAIDKMQIDTSVRNVLITHQFVTGAERTESEEISVGGADNVDVTVFRDFDYVALGHIHRAQNCGEKVRYCGTPLKYSFSEAKHEKSVTVAELCEKGNLTVRTVPLSPMREMREIKGKYMDLMTQDYYAGTDYREAYMHITLTDEEMIPDAVGKLRTVYHNLMKLDYDNKRTRTDAEIETDDETLDKKPIEIISEFYEMQNNTAMSKEQRELANTMIESIWEDEQ